jgi:MATE family multidrug resistance protein
MAALGAWAELSSTLKLAVPIVVGLASSTLIGVVDTIMIAPLGTTAMAGAALTTSAIVILYAALYGLVSVIGIGMANRFGAGAPGEVSAMLRNGAAMSFGIGVLAALFMIASFPLLRWLAQPPEVLAVMRPYWTVIALMMLPMTVFYVFKALFEAIERPWLGTAIAMLAVVVNVPLNYVLIHGIGGWHGLGLVGAAWASVIAETLSVLCAYSVWRYSGRMAPYRVPSRWSVALMRRQLREGAPVALAYTGEAGSFAFAGMMLGWFGATALAGYQIVNATASVIYMLPLGMAAAVGIRIGQAVGEGTPERVRVIGLGAIGAVVAWMLGITLLLVLSRGWIAGALSDDAEVIAIASAMFLTVAVMQVADGVQSTALGALRGLVDNSVPSMISLIAYWPVALPLAYVIGFLVGWGPAGVWVGYGLGLGFAAVALVMRFLSRTRL